jgi:hypothetical protein
MSVMPFGAVAKSITRIFLVLNRLKLLSPSEPPDFTVTCPKEIVMPSSNTLELYQSAGSPNSRRVRIFLAEKGLEVTLRPVDLGKGEQRSVEYRKINPHQVVPTLVLEDGTVIGEVPAIWRYLDETYPSKPLLGATPKEKALASEHVGAARGTRGVRGGDGGRPQLHAGSEGSRDCRPARL